MQRSFIQKTVSNLPSDYIKDTKIKCYFCNLNMHNRRQRLILPFMKRRRDPVTWIYDHRAGVFSILALALALAILFIGSRIVIRTPQPSDGILVDTRTIEEIEQEIARRERENRMLRSELDARQIRNAISNE